MLRIVPLYYALCIVALIIVPMIPALTTFAPRGDGATLYYWLFLQNFIELLSVKQSDLLAVSWSLAIEEQFYLVWPFLIWALGADRSLYAVWAIFVGQLVLRNVLYTMGISAEALYSWSFTHLDGITLGSILAIAWSDRQRYSGLLHWLRVQTWVTAPIFIALGIYASFNPVPRHVSYHPTMVTVGYALCGLMFTGVLLCCLERDNAFTHLFRGKVIRSCGRYSYAMYLSHFPVLWVLGQLMPGFHGTAHPARVLIASAFVITYVLSALSWHLAEKHILALKRYFPFSGKRNVGALSETATV
jgi:peptidoglycan/LPS O-acetylase OafA/YrhL